MRCRGIAAAAGFSCVFERFNADAAIERNPQIY